MEPKSGRKRPVIELRYYDLPEHEPVLVLQGEEWVRVYSDGTRSLHFHNLMEIGVCRWGEGCMALGDEDIPYEDGAVTVVPANCLHTTISKDASLNEWAYLFVDPGAVIHRAFPDDTLFADAVLQRLERQASVLSASESSQLRQMIEMVLGEYRGGRSFYHDELLQQLLTALLLCAAQLDTGGVLPVAHTVSTGLRQIIPAMEYINQNYMKSVSIADLAAQCSLSEAHLRRKFKEYLNMSPGDQLTLVRIRRGCELLNTTSFSVQEVALRVGYQSVSSFSRNFTKLVGTTPYHYKKHSGDYRGKPMRYRISAKKGWETRESE